MIKKLLIIISIWLSIFYNIENTFSASDWKYCPESDPFCLEQKVDNELKTTWKIDEVATSIINYLLWFLYLVAIIYWLYWAWHIISAWWEEEKTKKWRTIIIRAVIWLVVIFLAWPIARFIIWDKDATQNSWLIQAE